MGRIPELLSPGPWTYREDKLFFYVHDASGAMIASVSKNTVPRYALGNLLVILAAPELLEGLRAQPAYSDDWKKKVRQAYACAIGLVEHFLPARKRQ